jgi:hypothetical protein
MEEGPDLDVVEARDVAVVEAAREAVAEGGEVAPRGQHDATARVEVDGGSVRSRCRACRHTRCSRASRAGSPGGRARRMRWWPAVTKWSPGGRAGAGATPRGGR